MFTGKADLDYIRHRHSIWYDELVKDLPPEPEKEEKMEPSDQRPAEAAGEAVRETVIEEPRTGDAPAPEAAAEPPEAAEKSDGDKPVTS